MIDTDAQADLDAIRAILQRQPGDDLVCAVAALQVRCTELEAWWAQWTRVSMAALGMELQEDDEMPRYAAKKDVNHTTIARELTDIGCEVFDMSRLPGALDLIAAYRNRLVWLEIKQPHTRDDLTDLEQKTIDRLRRVGAPVFVVTTVDEALKAVGAI